MTFAEALKSGNPFRRKGELKYFCTLSGYMAEFGLREEDITSDDWEISEKNIDHIYNNQIREMLEKLTVEVDTLLKVCTKILGTCNK